MGNFQNATLLSKIGERYIENYIVILVLKVKDVSPLLGSALY